MIRKIIRLCTIPIFLSLNLVTSSSFATFSSDCWDACSNCAEADRWLEPVPIREPVESIFSKDTPKKNKKITPAEKAKAEEEEFYKTWCEKFETFRGKGGYTVNFIGWATIDAFFIDEDQVPQPGGAEIRRARLGATGSMPCCWEYELEIDFVRDLTRVRNVFLRYIGYKDIWFTVGHFKEPFGLEMLNSEKGNIFAERSLVDMYAPNRHIGFEFNYHPYICPHNFTFQAGVFSDRPALPQFIERGIAGTGRVTYGYYPCKRLLFLLGAAATERRPSDNAFVFFSTPPEIDFGTELINTGNILNVSHYNGINGEAALLIGPLLFQAEYTQANVFRHCDPEENDCTNFENALHFSGWYAQMTYFLTGEVRPFSREDARFLPIKETCRPCPCGALELGLRFSEAELNTGLFQGGREQNIAAAVKWYVLPYLSFGFNYIRVNANPSLITFPQYNGEKDKSSIFLLRMEYYFSKKIT